jgi:hypothetical protein
MTTTTVTVHDPGRAAEFRQVFGTTTVRVTSMVPVWAKLPNFTEPQQVYLIPLDWIVDGGHLDRLVGFLTGRFSRGPIEVRAALAADRVMPVLAADCTVSSDGLEFL